jgi:hypothetical protein
MLILTFSAVKPNNMEKQKVKLAYSVVSWPVRNALIFYAETLPTKFPATKVYPTVEFMDAARDFFDILNINHVKKGPIRSMASKKIQRLTEVSAYFESLLSTGILSVETRLALLQTVSASTLVIEKLLTANPNSFIFTARFQQDPLEEHFGLHRNHVGCAYRVTPQQFQQTERKLTNLSVLKNNQIHTSRERQSSLEWNDSPLKPLSKFDIDDIISADQFTFDPLCDHDYAKQPQTETEENLSELDSVCLDDSTESTLIYIRGSVMRKILNHTSCEICIKTLLDSIQENNSNQFIIQMDFSGNSLLEPTNDAMCLFKILLQTYLRLKPGLKTSALHENVLKKLCRAGANVIRKSFSLAEQIS